MVDVFAPCSPGSRLARAAVAAYAAVWLGACGGSDEGTSDAATDTGQSDVVDTVDAGPDVPEDTGGHFAGPCPGVQAPGPTTCELTEYGSNACQSTMEPGCADRQVEMACRDADNDKFHDDVPSDAIYVDKNVAFGNPDGSVGDPFASIADALAVATDGSTIVVVGAKYEEAVVIDGFNGLTLLGPGGCGAKARARIEPALAAGIPLTIRDSPNTRISGMSVGGGTGGIVVQGDAAGVLIEDCEVASAGGVGIDLKDPASAGVQCTGTLVRNAKGTCAVLIDGVSDVQFTDSEVRDAVSSGLCVRGATGLSIAHTTVTGSGGVGVALIDSEGVVSDSSSTDNDDGGIAIVGASAVIQIASSRVANNRRVGILIAGGAEGQIAQTYVGGTTPKSPGGSVAGISLQNAAATSALTNVRVHQTTGPGLAVFGDASGTPTPAPPGAADDALELREVAATSVAGAGIFVRGATGVRIVDSAINGVTADGGGEGGDGVSGASASFSVISSSIRGTERYGVSVESSKVRIEGTSIDTANADDSVRCALAVCNTVNWIGGGPAKGNTEGLPLPYAPISTSNVLPPL